MEKTGQKHINKNLVIGVTGNIGAGKSTVIQLIDTPLTTIINLDKIGHKILEYPEIKKKLVSLFGKYIITKNKINRTRVRKLIFFNKEILVKYNKIIHPVLIKELKKEIEKNKKKYSIIIVEAALIFELSLEKLMNKIICIKSNKLISYFRLYKKYSLQEFNKIFYSQLPVEVKANKSDITINNNLPLKLIKTKLKKKINNFIINVFNDKD